MTERGEGTIGRWKAMLVAGLVCVSNATFSAPPPNQQGRPVNASQPWRLLIASSIDLEPITLIELTGPGLANPQPFDGVSTPPLNSRVVRVIPTLWQMRVPGPFVDRAFQVSFEMRSPTGVVGQMEIPGLPGSPMAVQIQEIFQQPMPLSPRGAVWRGGVRLDFDVQNVNRSGAYSGTLMVTVTRL